MITYRQLGNGRLGNQLWKLASTVGIALERRERFAFPPWAYQPFFSLPEAWFLDLDGVECEDLGLDWLQELGYFEKIEPLIRKIFRPSEAAAAQLATRHSTFLALPHKTALHVRRGDYLDLPELYLPLSARYYEQAMALCEPPYVVFSDDIAWCRSNFPSTCYFMEGNLDWEDLFLMSTCDAVITANSTFSWWGAWLSTGRRLYPRQWFGPEMKNQGPLAAKLDPRLMFPPGAIVLDVT